MLRTRHARRPLALRGCHWHPASGAAGIRTASQSDALGALFLSPPPSSLSFSATAQSPFHAATYACCRQKRIRRQEAERLNSTDDKVFVQSLCRPICRRRTSSDDNRNPSQPRDFGRPASILSLKMRWATAVATATKDSSPRNLLVRSVRRPCPVATIAVRAATVSFVHFVPCRPNSRCGRLGRHGQLGKSADSPKAGVFCSRDGSRFAFLSEIPKSANSAELADSTGVYVSHWNQPRRVSSDK
jgi:hypothetical protein